MIPLSQYIRRGKAGRDIKINSKLSAPVVVAPKKDWKRACLEYQIKHGSIVQEIESEPASVCSINDIKEAVKNYFNLSSNDLESQRREARVMLPRQIVYYLATKLTDKSLPTIGRAIGFRDHTTVLSGAKKVERLIKTDETITAVIDTIEHHIRSGVPIKRQAPVSRFIKPSPWSSDDINLAIQLSGRGLTIEEIGKVVGRTGAAVRSRFRRIGLMGHASRVAVRREQIKAELRLVSSQSAVNGPAGPIGIEAQPEGA